MEEFGINTTKYFLKKILNEYSNQFSNITDWSSYKRG